MGGRSVGGWLEGALADVDGRHLLGGEPVGEGWPLPPPPVHAHPLPGNIVGQIHLEPRILCYLCCNGGFVKRKVKAKKFQTVRRRKKTKASQKTKSASKHI